jgi:hypothetical protein
LEGIDYEVILCMRSLKINIQIEDVGPKLLDNIFCLYNSQFELDGFGATEREENERKNREPRFLKFY